MSVRYNASLNGQYNAVIPTLKDGDYAPTQLDQFSRLLVSVQELPTNVANSSNQLIGNASLASIDSKLTSPINVLGPLTDIQLRASPISVVGSLTDTQLRAAPIPVSGTFFPATQPISVVSLPLPTGAATEATLSTRASQTTVTSILSALSALATIANQTTGNSTLASILTALAPIATASNQSTANTTLASILTALAPIATASNQNTANTSLASILSAVTGVSTATKQDSGNTTLASILSALATLSTAANQTTANTTLASILTALSPAATAVRQDTGNTSLSSIDSKLTQPSTGVITSVAQNPAQVTLLAANANRKGLYLYNDAGAKVFVSFAPTASATVFSFQLNSQTGYESPQANCYKGIITAIWNSGTTGFMRITELT